MRIWLKYSSIEYKLNALKETWVGVAQSILDRGDLGKMVDGLTALSAAISAVIDKVGLLGTVGIGAVGATSITKFFKNFDWLLRAN